MTRSTEARVIFLDKDDLLRVHRDCINKSGGAAGIRDEGLLESAVASPQHRWNYESTDAIGCAASLGFSLCQNHPFEDGNKRVAAVAVELMLELNGWTIVAGNDELEGLFLSLADHSIDRDTFEARLRVISHPKN